LDGEVKRSKQHRQSKEEDLVFQGARIIAVPPRTCARRK
jgi:hypothetical protein